jgi:YVTN family beta-propeller protein
VIDTRTRRRTGRIRIEGKGAKPMGLAMSRDGAQLFVSTGRGGSVACIDVRRERVSKTFDSVGLRPWGVALSPDGDRLYTANGPSNDVAVIDPRSGNVLGRIAAGKSPWGIAVRP